MLWPLSEMQKAGFTSGFLLGQLLTANAFWRGIIAHTFAARNYRNNPID